MAKFAEEFRDLIDTFATQSIIYQKKGEQLGRFGNSESDISFVEYTLRCVIVPDNKDKSKVDFAQQGKTDLAEGYILVYWLDLVDNGLVVNDILQMTPAKDFLVMNGERYEIIGTPSVGPDYVNGNGFVLVKIFYRREV
jgi:hypothetical protein